jgi:MFS family permease
MPAQKTPFTGPVRWLLTAGFVDYLGGGLMLAFSAVYFTTVVGLSVRRVGLGLAIGGCTALVAAVPIGALADRYGTRRTMVILHVLRAGAVTGYLLSRGWWSFVAAVTIAATADQAVASLNQALVAEQSTGPDRVRVLAVYRTMVNLAISIAAPIAGVVLDSAHNRSGYAPLLLANAAAYLAVAGLLLRIPNRRAALRTGRRLPAGVLRDKRLLTLMLVDTVMSLWLPLINVGFPLWLTGHTDAPHALIGILYSADAVTCVLLQVPAARFAATVPGARRAEVAAGALLAAGAIGLAAAATTHRAATIAVLAAGLVMITFGELVTVSAAWTLSYALAPAGRRGQYLSTFGMGRLIGRQILGPLAMAAVVTSGAVGWAILAIAFAAAGAATLRIPFPEDPAAPATPKDAAAPRTPTAQARPGSPHKIITIPTGHSVRSSKPRPDAGNRKV